MILAGLVAEPIRFSEWDLLELSETERAWLDVWVSHRRRPPEVVPYLEVLRVDGLGRTSFVVRPLVPCVTALP